jgi:alpha-glucosidase
VLKGKMGEYVAIARKKGNKWYIGVLNDWNERKMTLDLSFIERPDYTIEMYVDGVNANRKAEDYIYKTMDAPENDLLEITLKQGGGAAIVIE